jgi:hypothetical protein
MKIKGYIERISIDFNSIDMVSVGGLVPGIPTAEVTLKIIEGDFNGLIKNMESKQPIKIEIDFDAKLKMTKVKEEKKVLRKWRMIEVGDE